MFVGILQVEIFIPCSCSLKDKRKVINSLKDKIKSKFNVSIAEVDYHDKWQRTIIGLSMVNHKRGEIEIICQKIMEIFLENGDLMVINKKNNIFPIGEK